MREIRKRVIEDFEEDCYDIGNAPDLEKNTNEQWDTSVESDDNTTIFTGSSRGSSGSHQPMLGGSPSYRKPILHHPYRLPNRIIRWLCLALMSTVILFILSLIRMSWISSRQVETELKDKPLPTPPWESFQTLKGYYAGIRTLVPGDQNIPEYPRDEEAVRTSISAEFTERRSYSNFNPYPNYNSPDYKSKHGPTFDCFLDDKTEKTLPAVQSYSGLPQSMPDAIMGSYSTLDITPDMCFERYGRFGPYGFGYSLRRGGIGAGIVGEREGADEMWEQHQEVDYTRIQWNSVQARCAAKNQHRFEPLPKAKDEAFRRMLVERANITATNATTAAGPEIEFQPLPRIAFLVRTWTDFVYKQEDILHLRSLIAELSILSGGEYFIHFLIHVKDDNAAIWSDADTHERTLREALPKEFQGMGTLWSERQMGLIYGGLAESFYRELPVHGVYRSTFMPTQYFAHQHPEYDYVWNWEMDIRYTGHWYHLFERVQTWARKQPRKGLWERNGRFYVPSVHGSWEDFQQMVRVQSEMAVENPSPSIWAKAGPPSQGQPQGPPDFSHPMVDKPVWGPFGPEDMLLNDDDPKPPTSYEKDKYSWGIGEDADLITFSPIFDPDGTTWILSNDITGYNTDTGFPPRRATIITAVRLSRRLLDIMHRETALQRHTMFSEMWPASVALHHGLKAVYVPHPEYIDRSWPPQYLESVFNGGKNGASGGARTSVYGDREHNFQGTTWFYSSQFAPDLWKRWLGYRVDDAGGEEEEIAGQGRMCLPAMLIHPVKGVDLVVEGSRA